MTKLACFFTEKIEKYIQSKSGKRHVLSIIENILDFEPELKGTICQMHYSILTVLRKKKRYFLISDFLDQEFEKDLKYFNITISFSTHCRQD